MQIQIIGCGGYIGSRLKARLVLAGHTICSVSSSLPGGIDPKTGQLANGFAVPAGTEVVVYLAQAPHPQGPETSASHILAVNVLSAVQVAEQAARVGAGRFIYTSTGSVYMPTFKPVTESFSLRRDKWYSLSKVHAEEALALFRASMQVTNLRLFGVYGPGQTGRLIPNLAAAVLEGRPITIQKNPTDPHDLDGLKISLCYVEDVLCIIESVITRGGPEVLNVAGPRGVSMREIASIVGRIAGREPVFHVLDRFRDTDLVADITLLSKRFSPQFTDLEAGLTATIKQVAATLYV